MTIPPEAFPEDDGQVAPFVRDVLGLPGILDLHVHAMPKRLQQAVWQFFDGLDDPAWPVTYRGDIDQRLRWLRELGVVRHTALAYAHKPGMLRWLNDFTLGLAAVSAPHVVPTFTLFPEEGVTAEVVRCLARGGQVVKVHLQVGRFHATDPRLTDAWDALEAARTPVVMHASAVYGVAGGAEFCGAGSVADLLEAHPGLRLVVAHLGMPDFADFLALAEQQPTLLMDTAMILTDPAYHGAGYPSAALPRLRERHEQLVFGSDYPTIPHHYAAQLRGLAVLELDRSQLRALLHERAAALLAGVAAPSGTDR